MPIIDPFKQETDTDIVDPFKQPSDIVDPFATPEEKAPTKARPGVISELAQAAKDFPTHLKGSIAATLEGGDLSKMYAEKDWKDVAIEESRALTQKRMGELSPEEMQQNLLPGISVQDFRQLSPSMAFSVTGMGAGLAAGIPATALTSPLGGYAAGGAASYAAAYRSQINNFYRDLRERYDRDSMNAVGRPLSDEEFVPIAEKHKPEAEAYAHAEGAFEAAGNVAGLKLIRTPAKIFGKGLITRAASKLGAMYGSELATEIPTQMVQQRQEAIAGISPEKPREYTSLADWYKSAKEVAGPVILQTTLMGGMGAAGSKVYDIATGKKGVIQRAAEQAPPTEEVAEDTRPTITSHEALLVGQSRMNELAKKRDGVEEQEILDENGKKVTIPAELPQYMSEAEQVELRWLEKNKDNPEVLAGGLGMRIDDEAQPPATPPAAPIAPPGQEAAAGGEAALLAEIEAKGKPSQAPKFQRTLDEGAHEAATSKLNELPQPTQPQIEAGNYKTGATTVSGLNVSVENPQGSTRSSAPGAKNQWSVTMKDHYGYIRGVPARAPDKDHIDTFIKPGTPRDFKDDVYVVNQKDPGTGKFDEPKVMIGYGSEIEAKGAYMRNFSPGWGGFDSVVRVPMTRLKDMLQDETAFLKPIPRLGVEPKFMRDVRAAYETAAQSAEASKIDLPARARQLEMEAHDRITAEGEKMVADYINRFGATVDPDKAKMMFSEFELHPELAPAFHEPSSRLSKMVYARLLEDNGNAPVLFTAGGGASGKTETLNRVLADHPDIGGGVVMDTTLSSFGSAKQKIDLALESGAPVDIVYTNRRVEDAFASAIKRPRVVPIEALFEAHVGAANTIRQLAQHYKGNSKVRIYVMNNGDNIRIGKLSDVPLYDVKQVKEKLYEQAREARDNGTITQATYETLVSGRPEEHRREAPEGREVGGRPVEGRGRQPVPQQVEKAAPKFMRGEYLREQQIPPLPKSGKARTAPRYGLRRVPGAENPKYGLKVTHGKVSGLPGFVKDAEGIEKHIDDTVLVLAGNEVNKADAFWYKKAGDVIRGYSHGDMKVAEELTRLVAKFAQSMGINANVTAITQVHQQLAEGKPITAGIYPNEMRKSLKGILAADTMSDKLFGVDRKLMNFYRNLHDEVFQKNEWPDAVTVDRHAVSYVFNGEAADATITTLSEREYDYSEMLIKQATERFNKKHGDIFGRPLLPREVQALLWGVQKRRQDTRRGVSTEKPEAAWNYPEFMERATDYVTAEAIPSATVFDFLADADAKTKESFTRDALSVVFHDGKDELADAIHAQFYTQNPGTGGYAGGISPNVITGMLGRKEVGKKVDQKLPPVYTHKLADLYRLMWQYVFSQDAVPRFRADPAANPAMLDALAARRAKSGKGMNVPNMSLGYHVIFGKPLTAATESAFYAGLRGALGEDAGYTKVGDKDIVVINFRDDDPNNRTPYLLPDTEFGDRLTRLLSKYIGKAEAHIFGAETNYGYHDWKEDASGALIERQIGEAGRSDLLPRLRAWREEVNRVAETYRQGTGREAGRPVEGRADDTARLKFQRAIPTPKFKTDNPGGRWLEFERSLSKEEGKNEFGAPARFGSITGYFTDNVLIAVDKLAQVPGVRAEQKHVRKADLDWLTNEMGKTGKLPVNKYGEEYAPFIQIDMDGNPWVNEGNHRIMAAKALGWGYIPVEVRYFSGGEEHATAEWSPERLLADHASLQSGPKFSRAMKLSGKTKAIETDVAGKAVHKPEKAQKNWAGEQYIGKIPKGGFKVHLGPGTLLGQFAMQSSQYESKGPDGISYFKGEIDATRHVDVLLYRKDNQILGILNHFGFDFPPYEKKGNFLVLVHPKHQGEGIGRQLVLEAAKRWDVNLGQQMYTASGAALANSLARVAGPKFQRMGLAVTQRANGEVAITGNTFANRDVIKKIPGIKWDPDNKAWVFLPNEQSLSVAKELLGDKVESVTAFDNIEVQTAEQIEALREERRKEIAQEKRAIVDRYTEFWMSPEHKYRAELPEYKTGYYAPSSNWKYFRTLQEALDHVRSKFDRRYYQYAKIERIDDVRVDWFGYAKLDDYTVQTLDTTIGRWKSLKDIPTSAEAITEPPVRKYGGGPKFQRIVSRESSKYPLDVAPVEERIARAKKAGVIVDLDGDPVVFYHGTPFHNVFTEFKAEKVGRTKADDTVDVGEVYFFTNAPEAANAFATNAAVFNLDEGGAVKYRKQLGQILPVYLKPKNPAYFVSQYNWSSEYMRDAITLAKEHGHDAVIVVDPRLAEISGMKLADLPTDVLREQANKYIQDGAYESDVVASFARQAMILVPQEKITVNWAREGLPDDFLDQIETRLVPPEMAKRSPLSYIGEAVPSINVVVFDSSAIRSVHAEFAQDKLSESDLLFQMAGLTEQEKVDRLRGLAERALLSTQEAPESDQAKVLGLTLRMVVDFHDVEWGDAYEAVAMPDSFSPVAQAIEGAFGHRVIAVKPTKPKFNVFTGVTYGGDIFVNIDSGANFASVAGHELFHQLRLLRPDLYEWFAENARPYFRGLDQYKNKLDNLLVEGESGFDMASAEEELFADFAGESLTDTAFLQRLADASPSKFRQLVTAIQRFLRDAIGRLMSMREQFYTTYARSLPYVVELEEIHNHLEKVLVAFAEGKSISDIKVPPRFARGLGADAVKVTDTESFKRWFSDSKVVDADGKPLMLYHSTTADEDFSEFRVFSHFGTVDAATERLATRSNNQTVLSGQQLTRPQRILPVYLSITNPIRLPDMADILDDNMKPMQWERLYDVMDVLQDRGFLSEKDWAEINTVPLDVVGASINDPAVTHGRFKKVAQILQRKGYDGIVYKNAVEDVGHDSYIVFSPRQVKSAVGNVGTFNPASPNILMQKKSGAEFYSPLARAFENTKMSAMTGTGWVQWLKANQSKLGLKADEIKYSGIEEYFAIRAKDKVSKQDVVDYVSGNSVRTEETVYAEGETQYENWWGQVHKNGLPGTYREILVGWQRRGERAKVLHTIRERLAREGDTAERPYIMADIKRGFVKLLPEEEEALNAASAADRGGIVRYRPAHFHKDDVLVHLRLDEVEMNGKRYVRVGEIQSDWGQQGKKEGFDKPPVHGHVEQQESGDWAVMWDDGAFSGGYSKEEAERVEKAGRPIPSTPSAPFVTDTRNWVALGIKQAIRYAIDVGADGIVFGTGQENADLYDLSKQVDGVAWERSDYQSGKGDLYVRQRDSSAWDRIAKNIAGNELVNYIGKEAAEKIQKADESTLGGRYVQKLEGVDLQIGGEGMRTFYDQIVPSVAKQVMSQLKLQGDVGKVRIPAEVKYAVMDRYGYPYGVYKTEAEAEAEHQRIIKTGTAPELAVKQLIPQGAEGTLHASIPLTKDDRQHLIGGGIPLFQRAFTKPAHELPGETRWQATRRALQDKFLRFKVVQESIEMATARNAGYVGDNIHAARDFMDAHNVPNPVRETADVYQTESLFKSRVAARLQDFRETVIKPLVEKTVASGFSMNDVADYLLAQHAKEANARIRQIRKDEDATAFGITDEEAEAMLVELSRRPGLSDIANEWRGITAKTKQLLLDSGIISTEMADAWDAAYSFYVPVKGVDIAQPTGKGLTVAGKQRRRMGHAAREEAVIANIMRDYERAVILSEKNRVGHALLRFILNVADDDIATIDKPVRRAVFKDAKAYEVLYHGSTVGVFSSERDANWFVTADTVRSKRTPQEYTVVATRDPHVVMQASPLMADNETTVYVGGQAVRVQFNDPLLARAYNNLGIESVNKVLLGAQEFNTWLSRAYTGYNPEFLLRNVIRDAMQGSVTLTGRYGAATMAKIFSSYPAMARELARHFREHGSSAIVNEARDAGMQIGAAYLSDLERIGQDVMQAYNEYAGSAATYHRVYGEQIASGASQNKARTVAMMQSGLVALKRTPILGHFFKLMERVNSVGENALRLATYKTLRDMGKSKDEAASAAKNLMNFNRKGEITNQLGALYLFFNPNMQGTHVMLQALTTSKHKVQAQALAGMMALTAFTLAEMGRGGGDDDDEREWKTIPDHIKDRNIVVKFGDKQITIPVPYGFGMFHSLGNAFSDYVHGASPWKVGIRMTAAMMDNFMPLGNPITDGGKWSPFQFLPTIPKMLLGPDQNQNSFGAPIMPIKYQESKPDSQNMFRSTKGTLYSAVAEGMNEMTGGSKYEKGLIDVSPETLRFWVSSITGGTGRFLVDTVNLGSVVAQGATPEIREIPMARVLAREESINDVRRVYWDYVNQANQAAEEFSAAKRARDRMGMREIMDENRSLIQLAKYADRQGKMIKAKRDLIDEIRMNETYTLAQKREKIRHIEEAEARIYNKFINAFELKTNEQ